MHQYLYNSVIGKIFIVADEYNIIYIGFTKKEEISFGENVLIEKLVQELNDYFLGKRHRFSIPFRIEGTIFQQKVYKELIKIPYGQTISYKQLAINIGNVKACRAVGNAVNKNPLAIIIPCHRVIGVSGKLVGYAGGLDKKEKLLKIEK